MQIDEADIEYQQGIYLIIPVTVIYANISYKTAPGAFRARLY